MRSALRPFASSNLQRLALSVLLAGSTTLPATRAEACGTPAMLKNISPGSAASTPQIFHTVGNKLVFFANDGSNGIEPWVSDGSQLWRTGTTFTAGYGITDVNGTVFFPGSDGFSGVELPDRSEAMAPALGRCWSRRSRSTRETRTTARSSV